VIAPVVEGATAGQAGGRATEWAGTRKSAVAHGTNVKVAPLLAMDGKRKVMATRFICDTKIRARLSPFCAMRRDTAASGTKLGKQMRQFVFECAIDFRFAVVREPAVE
jgi:hypothetical protein